MVEKKVNFYMGIYVFVKLIIIFFMVVNAQDLFFVVVFIRGFIFNGFMYFRLFIVFLDGRDCLIEMFIFKDVVIVVFCDAQLIQEIYEKVSIYFL